MKNIEELEFMERPYKGPECLHSAMISIGNTQYCPSCDEFINEEVRKLAPILSDKQLIRLAIADHNEEVFLESFKDGYSMSSLLSRRASSMRASRRMQEVQLMKNGK